MNSRSSLPIWLAGVVAILLISTVAYFLAEQSSRMEAGSESVDGIGYGTSTSSSGGGVDSGSGETTAQVEVPSQVGAGQVGTQAQPPATGNASTNPGSGGVEQVPPTGQAQVGQPQGGGSSPTNPQVYTTDNPAIAPTQPSTSPSTTLPPETASQYQSFRITTCEGLAEGANFRVTPGISPATILGVVPAGETVLLTGRQTQADGVFWRQAVNPNPLAESIEPGAQNQTTANQVGWVANCFVATGFTTVNQNQ